APERDLLPVARPGGAVGVEGDGGRGAARLARREPRLVAPVRVHGVDVVDVALGRDEDQVRPRVAPSTAAAGDEKSGAGGETESHEKARRHGFSARAA